MPRPAKPEKFCPMCSLLHTRWGETCRERLMAEVRSLRREEREPRDAEAWVIECTQSGTTDWSALFWAPNRCGYTTDLASAGRYTEAEAKEQERHRPGVDIAHRLSDVLALAKPRVDRDTLRRICIERQRAAALAATKEAP
jgi:hypothetical protein